MSHQPPPNMESGHGGPLLNKRMVSDMMVITTWVATGFACIVALIVVFYAATSPAVVNSHNMTALMNVSSVSEPALLCLKFPWHELDILCGHAAGHRHGPGRGSPRQADDSPYKKITL